jgi:uncharacterized membrane protein YpjA
MKSREYAFKIACAMMTCHDLEITVYGFTFYRDQLLKGKL